MTMPLSLMQQHFQGSYVSGETTSSLSTSSEQPFFHSDQFYTSVIFLEPLFLWDKYFFGAATFRAFTTSPQFFFFFFSAQFFLNGILLQCGYLVRKECRQFFRTANFSEDKTVENKYICRTATFSTKPLLHKRYTFSELIFRNN